MKTFSQKPADVTRKWYVIDASTMPLGRLSTAVASLLIGKSKPTITPHVDAGDFVIVTNAAKLVVTGQKADNKFYYRHSGFPGGLKQKSLSDQVSQDPTKVIFDSVRGMLPVNKLRDGRLDRLKIYADENHKHSAQKPESYSKTTNKEAK